VGQAQESQFYTLISLSARKEVRFMTTDEFELFVNRLTILEGAIINFVREYYTLTTGKSASDQSIEEIYQALFNRSRFGKG